MRKKIKLNSGFSMIEILIILIVIPIISIITTQSLINVLSSQRKIDSEIRVRGNIEHILSYVERRILNASDLVVTNPTANTTVLTYTNATGTVGRFVCTMSSIVPGKIEHEEEVGDGLIKLSDSDVDIYKCQIVETVVINNNPKGIKLTLGGKITNLDTEESGQVELTTIIYTRSRSY